MPTPIVENTLNRNRIVLFAAKYIYLKVNQLNMLSKYINAGGLGFILICFLFPFISIKCNEQTLATVKGYEMITGKSNLLGDNSKLDNLFGDNKKEKQENDNTDNPIDGHSEEETNTNVEEDTNSPTDTDGNDKKGLKPSMVMIVLAGLALIGILIMLVAKDKIHPLGLGLSIAMLLCLLVQVILFEIELSQMGKSSNGMFSMVIKIGYETGFWLMLICLLALMAYNIYSMKKTPKAFAGSLPVEPDNTAEATEG